MVILAGAKMTVTEPTQKGWAFSRAYGRGTMVRYLGDCHAKREICWTKELPISHGLITSNLYITGVHLSGKNHQECGSPDASIVYCFFFYLFWFETNFPVFEMVSFCWRLFCGDLMDKHTVTKVPRGWVSCRDRAQSVIKKSTPYTGILSSRLC